MTVGSGFDGDDNDEDLASCIPNPFSDSGGAKSSTELSFEKTLPSALSSCAGDVHVGLDNSSLPIPERARSCSKIARRIRRAIDWDLIEPIAATDRSCDSVQSRDSEYNIQATTCLSSLDIARRSAIAAPEASPPITPPLPIDPFSSRSLRLALLVRPFTMCFLLAVPAASDAPRPRNSELVLMNTHRTVPYKQQSICV